MEFGWDATTEGWQRRLPAFMDDHVYPAEAVFAAQTARRRTGAPGGRRRCSPSSGRRPRPPGCGTCSCPATAEPG